MAPLNLLSLSNPNFQPPPLPPSSTTPAGPSLVTSLSTLLTHASHTATLTIIDTKLAQLRQSLAKADDLKKEVEKHCKEETRKLVEEGVRSVKTEVKVLESVVEGLGRERDTASAAEKNVIEGLRQRVEGLERRVAEGVKAREVEGLGRELEGMKGDVEALKESFKDELERNTESVYTVSGNLQGIVFALETRIDAIEAMTSKARVNTATDSPNPQPQTRKRSLSLGALNRTYSSQVKPAQAVTPPKDAVVLAETPAAPKRLRRVIFKEREASGMDGMVLLRRGESDSDDVTDEL